MHSLSNMSWLLEGGDFNEILFYYEKFGGNNRNIFDMNYFRHVLNDHELYDLGTLGPKFTWCNNRSGQDVIFE
ncbi:hypothetical protein ACS0TY_020288 [Phlomoides rotata]